MAARIRLQNGALDSSKKSASSLSKACDTVNTTVDSVRKSLDTNFEYKGKADTVKRLEAVKKRIATQKSKMDAILKMYTTVETKLTAADKAGVKYANGTSVAAIKKSTATFGSAAVITGAATTVVADAVAANGFDVNNIDLSQYSLGVKGTDRVCDVFPEASFEERVQILKQTNGFQEGDPWGKNGTTVTNYKNTENNWSGSQCMSMAMMMQGEVVGGNWYTTGSKNWDDIQVGDVVHYDYTNKDGGTTQHWVFVTGVEGDKITVGEGNYSEKVKWDRTVTRDSIKNIYHIDRVKDKNA